MAAATHSLATRKRSLGGRFITWSHSRNLGGGAYPIVAIVVNLVPFDNVFLGVWLRRHAATQDWWTHTVPAFQLPGLTYEAYGRPLITILPVLSSVLLLLPLFRAFRWTLDECNRPLTNVPISILALLSWTALAAVILTWIRFLGSELAPQTGYSSSTVSQNFKEHAFHLSLTLFPASVLMGQLFAWRSHWLIAVIVLIVGWVVDSLATGFATHAIATITGSSFGVLSADSLGRWCYIGGRSLMGFTFGGLALLFGIRIRRSQPKHRQTTEQGRAPEPRSGPGKMDASSGAAR